VPHDARVREFGTGRTRVETMKLAKLKPRLVPGHKIMDGINAARVLFPRIHFDAERCKDGLEALRQYHAEYDEKTKAYKDNPRHDWTSHAADAFRYLAMAYRELKAEVQTTPAKPKGINEMTWNDLMASQRPKKERV
jgi:phage terminase large subunit